LQFLSTEGTTSLRVDELREGRGTYSSLLGVFTEVPRKREGDRPTPAFGRRGRRRGEEKGFVVTVYRKRGRKSRRKPEKREKEKKANAIPFTV